ncbi:glycerophosphodiester phosphodiesterase family protein [Aurantiacibacter sp. MUD11]|uniref:glycerophosphodiester phosphodiesterase family protein n=1 Tax=Aurantiacibacter sp. MUD11 TaxID=3003265 RepID=UPI0022AAA0BF|nr:glycerophosphodiester phosphodiesterase family protein [Aurantiacibacter sp. MUD11]WAT17337.1 glycerophosphodiester phosphodiesterase family protein [Aurantiacibacter sp. MUD11]
MRTDKVSTLAAWAYAHRGLHDTGVPENSLAAFRAAIDAGLGIECDIRKSSDGRAIVFHDAELERLTGRAGKMGVRSVGDLTSIALLGSEERIPTLRDALELVAGKVPLLLEIKSDNYRSIEPLCRAVRRDLEGYTGAVGVMSFDPRVPQWFGKHEPECPRGLVVTEQNERTLIAGIKRRVMVARSKPDFVALDIRDLPSSFSRKQAAAGRPLFTWTVRSAAQVDTALAVGAAPILEGAGVAAWEQAS